MSEGWRDAGGGWGLGWGVDCAVATVRGPDKGAGASAGRGEGGAPNTAGSGAGGAGVRAKLPGLAPPAHMVRVRGGGGGMWEGGVGGQALLQAALSPALQTPPKHTHPGHHSP